MITLADLLAVFSEEEILKLSDINKNKTINHEVVDRAIKAATNEVAGYLRSVGLVKNVNGQMVYVHGNLPDDFKQKLCDIARWYLHGKAVTPLVQKRYEIAINWFKAVQKNPKMLTGVDEDDNNQQTNNQSTSVHVIPNKPPNIYWS